MTARTLFSLVIGASLIASAALAGAQGGPPPGQMGGMRGGQGGPGGRGPGMMQKFMDDELKKVHATTKQVNECHAYNAHAQRAMAAYRKANPTMDRTAMRPMMEKMRAERTAFLKKTLTAKQYKQWDADMKAMRGKMGGGRGGPGRGGPPKPPAP